MMRRAHSHPLSGAIKRQKNLGRYLVHLRQRCSQRNLNIVVGAGATRDAGTPLWEELIERIRKDMGSQTSGRVNPLKAFSPAMAAEVLLKWLEARIDEGLDSEEIASWGLPADGETAEAAAMAATIPPDKKPEYANNRWLSCIRRAVYKKVPKSTDKRIEKHPYLQSLSRLVARCPLTINFNFDDVIDAATVQTCAEEARELPNVVWRLPFGYQSKGCTILHINGFLPYNGKADSNYLVLTEGAFAELMLQKTDYQSISLLRAFAESTMLILGCSLDDISLKAILQTSARLNKSNFHYMIHFVDGDEKRLDPHFDKIFKANLSVYNLITIFLRRDEYDAFLSLIAAPQDSDFEVGLREMDPESRSKFLFYIVGAVGCGKTTLIRNLRLFQTYEEWSARPPEQMYRDTTTLDIEEKKQVDTFLKSQLRYKNQLMRTASVGFHVMDRSYLDLLAFSDNNGENDSKLEMLKTFVRGNDGLQNGVIVLLEAEPADLEDSQWMRGQLPKRFGGEGFTLETLEQQQRLLKTIYKSEGTQIFKRKDHDYPPSLASAVAYMMLTGSYEPIDFDERLDKIERGELADLYVNLRANRRTRKRPSRRGHGERRR